MAVDEETVIAAFRTLLGREPESRQTIIQATGCATFKIFLDGLVASEEYRQKSFMHRVGDGYRASAQPVQVDVPPDILQKLIERTQRGWKRLGETEPYWSVLTDDRFRASAMDAHARQEFYNTGRDTADLLDVFENRAGTTVRRGTCFELGCGVGRVTRVLARRFARVIAVDISPGNLEICRKTLSDEGITNVDCRLIERLQDYEAFEPFDFFYSFIVLQHNSPPIQKYILDQLTRKIRGGGGALFQTPGTLARYAFDAARYLASPDQTLEMHALPMPVVLGLLQQNGLIILEAATDTWTGDAGSHTYFAVRPQSATQG